MENFLELISAALISSAVVSAVVGYILLRRAEIVRREVESQFQRLQDTVRSQRSWRERAVAELFGPICIQLDRTRRALERYTARNLFLEAKVMREGNLAIRDLLLSRPHLVPPELFNHAGSLIEHYDRWLEEYERVRSTSNPDLDAPFVFVGPAGYPFPSEAEKAVKQKYDELWRDLYGDSSLLSHNTTSEDTVRSSDT